jgi:dTDP-4-dehydrorhamnose 3,5-epimerase-like enzyme
MGMIDQVRSIVLPVFTDHRGSLLVLENDCSSFPFSVKRSYVLFDISPGAVRAGHAHKKLNQLFVCVGGSFSLRLNDGESEKTYLLDSPSVGVLIPSGIWRDLVNFSPNTSCLVLADAHYDENDYLRDFSQFKEWKIRESVK